MFFVVVIVVVVVVVLFFSLQYLVCNFVPLSSPSPPTDIEVEYYVLLVITVAVCISYQSSLRPLFLISCYYYYVATAVVHDVLSMGSSNLLICCFTKRKLGNWHMHS